MDNLALEKLKPSDIAVAKSRLEFGFVNYDGTWDSYVAARLRDPSRPIERAVMETMRHELRDRAEEQRSRMVITMRNRIAELMGNLFDIAISADQPCRRGTRADFPARIRATSEFLKYAKEFTRGGDTHEHETTITETYSKNELEQVIGRLSLTLKDKRHSQTIRADDRASREAALPVIEDIQGRDVQGEGGE